MAERKPFLLRIDKSVLGALQRWADDDLRSLNGQIEFVLRRALSDHGRAAPMRTTRNDASRATSPMSDDVMEERLRTPRPDSRRGRRAPRDYVARLAATSHRKTGSGVRGFDGP